MFNNKLNIFNKISVLGFGIIMLSLGILFTLETPRQLLEKRAKFLFWLGTATALIGGGIDYYFRSKNEQSLTLNSSQNSEFWNSLEQEVYQNHNQN